MGDGKDKDAAVDLVKAFGAAATTELLNKEMAAMMRGLSDTDNPDVLPGGRQSILGHTEAKLSSIKKKKRAKTHRDYLLRVLREARARLAEIIAFYQDQMDELWREMDKQAQALDELDKQHCILETELAYFEEHGRFNVDEHGRFTNQEAEDIRKAWERKIGRRLDLNHPDSYDLLLNISQDIKSQKQRINLDLEANKVLFGNHKQKRDTAIKLRRDLQSDDPVKQQRAFTRYDRVFDDFDSTDEPASDQEISDKDPENIESEFLFDIPSLQETFSNTVSSGEQPEQSEPVRPSSSKTRTLGPGG